MTSKLAANVKFTRIVQIMILFGGSTKRPNCRRQKNQSLDNYFSRQIITLKLVALQNEWLRVNSQLGHIFSFRRNEFNVFKSSHVAPCSTILMVIRQAKLSRPFTIRPFEIPPFFEHLEFQLLIFGF